MISILTHYLKLNWILTVKSQHLQHNTFELKSWKRNFRNLFSQLVLNCLISTYFGKLIQNCWITTYSHSYLITGGWCVINRFWKTFIWFTETSNISTRRNTFLQSERLVFTCETPVPYCSLLQWLTFLPAGDIFFYWEKYFVRKWKHNSSLVRNNTNLALLYF